MTIIGKDTVRFAFDPTAAPAAVADAGETVRFLTRDCYDGQLIRDGMDFAAMDMTRSNPISGPLFIREARPGDTLRIDVLSVTPDDHGVMCIRTGRGIYAVEGCHCRRFPIRDGVIRFDRDLEIPVRPMIGVIGVAPAEGADTHTPGEHGGNMDIRELGAGSTLYLPVYVPGALLSLGDLHAVQGDGETAICGMEMSGAVDLRVTVIPGDAGLPTPFLVTDRAVYTTAAAESLDECSVTAARKMHRFLIDRLGLTDAQAAMLLSLKGNLRITQVVNPRKGCMMELPVDLLRALAGGKEIF